MVSTFEARILPSRLMTGTPRYTGSRRDDPVLHVWNVRSRNLAHGVNDLDRARASLNM
jgi:hypothetical protein